MYQPPPQGPQGPYGYGQQQPTIIVQQQSSGCLKAFLVVLGIIVVGNVATCATCAVMAKSSPPQSAEEKQRQAQTEKRLQEEAADAAAQEQARLETEFRKGCKLPASKPIFTMYDSNLRERCQDMIRESLKVPGSGDFPSEREQPTSLVSDDGGCDRIFRSYVDAKNAFGVKVRTRYECKYDPRTGLVSTKSLD